MSTGSVTLQWQAHRRPQEGLALFWAPVTGVLRYACLIGYADLAAPTLDAVMRGNAPGFTLLGIPPQYSGAVDVGSPVGEERQYSLVAYCASGILQAVDFQVSPARGAPRDREYHSMMPQSLSRPAGTGQVLAPEPSRPAAAAQVGDAGQVGHAAVPFAQSDAAPMHQEGYSGQASTATPVEDASDTQTPAAQPTPEEEASPAIDVVQPAAATPFRVFRDAVRPRSKDEIALEAAPMPASTRDPVATPGEHAAQVAADSEAEHEPSGAQPPPPTLPETAAVEADTVTGPASQRIEAVMESAPRTIAGQPPEAVTMASGKTGAPTDPGLPADPGSLATRPAVAGPSPEQATGAGADHDPEVGNWMRSAEQAMDAHDQWAAVDFYEQVLARYPEYAAARRGLVEARALAQWSAQMAGAGDDARRLLAVGDAFVASAPTLAARSYEAAFAARPTIIGLRQWLLALHASEQPARLSEVARRGVAALRAAERVHVDASQEAACDALETAAGASGLQAIEHLSAVLVASAQAPHR
jgi:hypothetical protein